MPVRMDYYICSWLHIIQYFYLFLSKCPRFFIFNFVITPFYTIMKVNSWIWRNKDDRNFAYFLVNVSACKTCVMTLYLKYLKYQYKYQYVNNSNTLVTDILLNFIYKNSSSEMDSLQPLYTELSLFLFFLFTVCKSDT